jgi:hypothetical protein
MNPNRVRSTAMKAVPWLIAGAVFAGPAGQVAAQGSGPRPPRCDAREHRQLDFWVGQWDVTMGGRPAGTNLVTLEERGCAVHEHWTGTGGETGQSLNFYDRGDRRWHQVWISSSGNALQLAGEYAGGTLTFRGEARQPGGQTVQHRLSFHRNADGTVRQLWETSADGGRSWQVSFDGLYRKHTG